MSESEIDRLAAANDRLAAANDRLEDVITDLNGLVAKYSNEIADLKRRLELAEDAHITLSRAFR